MTRKLYERSSDDGRLEVWGVVDREGRGYVRCYLDGVYLAGPKRPWKCLGGKGYLIPGCPSQVATYFLGGGIPPGTQRAVGLTDREAGRINEGLVTMHREWQEQNAWWRVRRERGVMREYLQALDMYHELLGRWEAEQTSAASRRVSAQHKRVADLARQLGEKKCATRN